MEGNLQAGSADIGTMHVKTEAVDESSSALVLGSQDSPAPCGDTACRGAGGGGVDQTAEEVQAATTSTPVLLCECTARRCFRFLSLLILQPDCIWYPTEMNMSLC